MLRTSRLLAPLAVLAAAGAAFAAGLPVKAAPSPPTPGQLDLFNRAGKPVGRCPLKHTDVQAEVTGFGARVTVRQEFQNTATEPLEAVYTFPLPADAAVDDMTMTVGSRTIRGEIKPREEARRIYETARAMGQTASLLDQERPNIFTQSVANLTPGASVTVAITYVQMLRYDRGSYELTFPMVVGPRYVGGAIPAQPGESGSVVPVATAPAATSTGDPSTTPVVTDAAKITPPIAPQGTRAGHDISLTVKLDAGVPLQAVDSQLHSVNIQRRGTTGAVIRLRDQATIPNKDFILRYKVAGDQIGEGLLTYRDAKGNGYFALILQPPAAPARQMVSPKEMVFVIDQTGSQRGQPIEKAKETIRYCLENLNPGDTFQVLGFNTATYPCFEAPVPVTAENVRKAHEFIAPLEGNGATDILKAVDYVLKIPADPSRARIVCYMTDGYVGNDFQILDHIRKNRADVRMFPFGVGNSVNRFLIDGMAREGRGVPYYLTLSTAGNQASADFYQRVSYPLLLNPGVEWGSLPVTDVYPRALPDLFSAGPIVVKGRYTKAAEGDIEVHGLLNGRSWSRRIHVSLPATSTGGQALESLWAREKIEDLQAEDWMGAQSGQPHPEITDQIMHVALDHRLMSQYTSFVAVEQRVVNIGGRQRTVDVPVEMPEGVSFDGIFGRSEEQVTQLGLAFGKVPSQHWAYRGAQPYGGAPGAAGYGFGASNGAVAGAGIGGGGLGGGVAGRAVAGSRQEPAARRPSLSKAAAPKVAAELKVLRDKDAYGDTVAKEVDARKLLAAMPPKERREYLVRQKLVPSLQSLALPGAKVEPAGKEGRPEVAGGRVVIQVWVDGAPKEYLAKLKALGFAPAATLMPGRLELGTLPVAKLGALAELAWVRVVQAPKLK